MLAKKFLMSQETGRAVVDEIFKMIETDLLEGRKVVIVGFGTFHPDRKPSRQVEFKGEHTVPEHIRIRFSPSKSLRDKCRQIKAQVKSAIGKDFLRELRRTD